MLYVSKSSLLAIFWIRLVIFVSKTDDFWSRGRNRLNFWFYDCKSRCIQVYLRVKLPKYAYTLIYLNTVAPTKVNVFDLIKRFCITFVVRATRLAKNIFVLVAYNLLLMPDGRLNNFNKSTLCIWVTTWRSSVNS